MSETECQSLLVRLIMHPTNNPHLIDKLIILKGLPYEWVFKKSKYKIENEDGSIDEGVCDQLKSPWEPDADVNIPREVRDLTQPITYLRWFPSVSLATGIGPKSFHGFWDKNTCWGLRLDYGFGPAQELWLKIEEYIDKTLSRGERMPEAVQVAKDHKSEFRTYLAKRGKTLSSLEMIEMDVPVVDLRRIITPTQTGSSTPEVIFKTIVTVPADPQPPTPEPKAEDTIYKCEDCSKEFDKAQALRMHRTKMHRREKVKV